MTSARVHYHRESGQDAFDHGVSEGQWAAMRAAVKFADGLRCAVCGSPATCIGAYEAAVPVLPACDDCCGHGCEDGSCCSLDDARAEYDASDEPEVSR
jgi:hypothetical protein